MQCLERKGILKLGVCSLIGTCLCGTADGRSPHLVYGKDQAIYLPASNEAVSCCFTTISITILVASLQIDLH